MPSKLNKMTHNQDHRSHLFTQTSLKMKNKTNPSLQYKLVLSKVNIKVKGLKVSALIVVHIL